MRQRSRFSGVNLETLVYGAVFALVFSLIAWRLGLKRRPWREYIAWVLLYTALLLAVKASGVVDGTESITIAFIAATLLVGAWNRFARRRPDNRAQRI